MIKIIKHRINHEMVVLDAKTTIKELFTEIVINFLYGFLGNATTVLIISRNPILMPVGFMFYYAFLSIIINRDRYETKLAKYLVFPISSTIGAIIGVYVASHITI